MKMKMKVSDVELYHSNNVYVGGDYDKISVGTGYRIVGGYYSKIFCGDDCVVMAGDESLIVCGVNCTVLGGCSSIVSGGTNSIIMIRYNGTKSVKIGRVGAKIPAPGYMIYDIMLPGAYYKVSPYFEFALVPEKCVKEKYGI